LIPGARNTSPVWAKSPVEGLEAPFSRKWVMNSSGPKPDSISTAMVRPSAAISSSRPLMNCTQVVETIPAVAVISITTPPTSTTPQA